MKRKSNKKYFIVLLLIAVLLLAVGYAAFSDQLNITGSASANGTFDIQFARKQIVEVKGVEDESAVTCDISDDGKTLTVAVPKMQYPGAGARFSVTIENKGTIPAKVNGLIAKVNGKDVTADLNNTKLGERPEATIGTEHIRIAGLGIFNAKINTNDVIMSDDNKPYLQPNGGNCNFTFSVYWDEETTTELTQEEIDGIKFELQIDYEQVVDTMKNPDINDHGDAANKTAEGAFTTYYPWEDPRYDYITAEQIYKLETKGAGYTVDPVFDSEDNVIGIKVTSREDGTVVDNWQELLEETTESTGGVGINSGFDGDHNIQI